MARRGVFGSVGVPEPILCRHFSSKHAILCTLLDEVIARMMAAFRELSSGETDPVAALRRICRAYPELSRRYRRGVRVLPHGPRLAKESENPPRLARPFHAPR